ncbi:MAG: ATP-binding protein [Patescibacteria group bacterium]|nr:ATP-binding protein [Patescibacteria group bacterium]
MVNFLLALIVLRNNPRNIINKVFFLISVFLGLWGFSLLFYQFPLIFSSLAWIKMTYLSASFYLIFVLAFSFIFPTAIYRQFWRPAAFFSLIFLAVTIWLLFFTKIWIIDVVVDPQKGLQTIWGNGYYLWLLIIWISIIWTFINLIIKSRHSSGLRKLQLKFFSYSFVLFSFLVTVSDGIVPIFFNDTRLFYTSAIFSIIFSGVTAYAILKHRFMDIHLVVARSISYFLLLFSFGVFYSLTLFLCATFIIAEPIAIGTYALFSLIALAVAFSFQPLLAFFQRITDNIFYKQNYNESRLLYDLALLMASTFSLVELTDKLLEKIMAAIRVSFGAFVLIDNKKIFHLVQRGYAGKMKISDGDISRFVKQTQIVLFDELPENALKETMRRLNINVIIPLRVKGETEDVLIFGEKLSGNPYTDKDISFFQVFASAASAAIKNVSNVEQIMRLDELKSEFVNVVSHQLRTPLSVARWNFEMILDNVFGKLPPKVEQITRDTYLQFVTLNRGLNNLMAVLEIEKNEVLMKYDKIDIDQAIIKEVISDLAEVIKEKKITIKQENPIARKFSLDQKKIKAVFEIILDNAIRYSPDGSTITISQTLRKGKRKNEILISVADRGIGILSVNKEAIFTKFFRGEEAKKMSPDGFGLGLFMAKKYVKYHGGDLWFEKNKAGGSTFSFFIPERTGK